MLGRLRGQDCPELSPYLPLTHSAVSCLYTVTTDTAVYRQALTVSGGKLCTHNHSMKEACFRWVMSTFTLGSLILSKPQPNLNTTVGFDNKMTLQTPPTQPTTQTQHQQYLSCYWPDFDETLKVGSCEHLEHIPTVWVTFVHAIFVLATFVHIRNISAVTDPILMKLYR